MKTAISIPDDVYNAVEHQVARLGISRSDFYRRAAERYLVEIEVSDLTHRIDEAVRRGGVPAADSSAEAAELGARRLAELTPGDDW